MEQQNRNGSTQAEIVADATVLDQLADEILSRESETIAPELRTAEFFLTIASNRIRKGDRFGATNALAAVQLEARRAQRILNDGRPGGLS